MQIKSTDWNPMLIPVIIKLQVFELYAISFQC